MTAYVLTGAPGSGKTALAAALHDAYGYPVVAEAATDVIAAAHRHGIAEPEAEPRFIDDIIALQRSRICAIRDVDGVVLLDRSPVCTLALARYLGHPETPGLTAAVAAGGFDRRVFFVRPLGAIERTAARRISYADAQDFGRVHEQCYGELGYELVDVPASSLADRVCLVGGLLRGWR